MVDDSGALPAAYSLGGVFLMLVGVILLGVGTELIGWAIPGAIVFASGSATLALGGIARRLENNGSGGAKKK